jgi:acetyl esterase/lipase
MIAVAGGLLGWLGAAGPAAGQEVVPLWPAGAPGARGAGPADVPTLTLHRAPAETANGAMVIVCPGGGYGMLASDHEGAQPAKWLNSLGVTAGVLRYRHAPDYRHPAPLQDAQRAIRLARARAADWGVDPGRVGILGFSAGGHLASTAGTHFDAGDPDADDPIDRQPSRPDLLLLGYPVIALATEYGHAGSRKNLLGESPDPALLASLSNERAVSAKTPPTFLVQTNEDSAVVAENSLLFVMALRKAGVPVEFHLFEKGRHGLGLGGGEPKFNVPPDPAFAAWPALAATWMKGRGFLDRAGEPAGSGR